MPVEERIETMPEVRPQRTRAMEMVQFLGDLREGRLPAQYHNAIRDVANAVKRTGRKGSITLRVEVLPKGDGCVVADVPPGALKTSIPEGEYAASTFYVDDFGNLSKRNPDRLGDLE